MIAIGKVMPSADEKPTDRRTSYLSLYYPNRKRTVQMLSSPTHETGNRSVCSIEEEARKLGIKRVKIEQFLYRDFRYTDLNDAIAQAKRDMTTVKGERAP